MLDLFPGVPEWSVQTLRLLAQARYGGSDLNECAATAERIRLRDEASWLADFFLPGAADHLSHPDLARGGRHHNIMRPEGARRLYDEVGSREKVLKIWAREEGGAVHCNYDNWSVSFPFMYDWLADRLR